MITPPEDVEFITLSEQKTPELIYCVACRKFKVPKEFQRKVTRRQALAWGRKGNHAMYVESKHCADCRAEKKRRRPLTPSEMEKKIYFGDMKGGAVGELMLRERIEDGIARKRGAVKRRWDKQRSYEWQAVFDSVSDAHTTFRRLSYQTFRHPDVLNYFNLVRDITRDLRDIVKAHMTDGTKCPKDTTAWQQLLTNTQRADILSALRNIPQAERAKMRVGVVNLTIGDE